MVRKLTHILTQEVALVEAALQSEKQKRRAILAADGRELQTLTDKSAAFMQELDRMYDARALAMRSVIDHYGLAEMRNTEMPDMNAMLAALEQQSAVEALEDLTRVVARYRESAHALKALNDENRELLEKTSSSIHRLLVGLQEELDDSREKIYAPEKQTTRKNTGSILLNANA